MNGRKESNFLFWGFAYVYFAVFEDISLMRGSVYKA